MDIVIEVLLKGTKKKIKVNKSDKGQWVDYYNPNIIYDNEDLEFKFSIDYDGKAN